MAYLVYLVFFVLGWVLSKHDSSSLWKKNLKSLSEQAFKAGAMYGHEETIRIISAQLEDPQVTTDNSDLKKSTTVGFCVPTTVNKDDNQ